MEYWRDGKANPPLQKSIRSLKEIGIMKINTKQITLTSLFIALCVIVPFLFHLVGLGAIFLPMFLPILLAGFLIEFRFALLVGLLGPLTSSLTTGMPPFFRPRFRWLRKEWLPPVWHLFCFTLKKNHCGSLCRLPSLLKELREWLWFCSSFRYLDCQPNNGQSLKSLPHCQELFCNYF